MFLWRECPAINGAMRHMTRPYSVEDHIVFFYPHLGQGSEFDFFVSRAWVFGEAIV